MTLPEIAGDAAFPQLAELPVLRAGERIRVVTGGERIDGHVVMVTADEVTLRVRGVERCFPVGAIGEIARLGTYAKRGGIMLGALGAVAAGFVGAAIFSMGGSDGAPVGALIGGVVGFVFGGVVGAGVGAVLTRAQRVFVAAPGALAVGRPTAPAEAGPTGTGRFNYLAVLVAWFAGQAVAWFATTVVGSGLRLVSGVSVVYAIASSLFSAAVAGAAAATVLLRMESARPRDHIRALIVLAAVTFLFRYGSSAGFLGSLGSLSLLIWIGAYAGLAHVVYRRETGAVAVRPRPEAATPQRRPATDYRGGAEDD